MFPIATKATKHDFLCSYTIFPKNSELGHVPDWPPSSISGIQMKLATPAKISANPTDHFLPNMSIPHHTEMDEQ